MIPPTFLHNFSQGFALPEQKVGAKTLLKNLGREFFGLVVL